jgi:hypothetical protein
VGSTFKSGLSNLYAAMPFASYNKAQGAAMDWFLPLIAGLGLGSIMKSVADHFMTRRASKHDRWYQEKREAYTGLLTALHDAAVRPSDANAKAFALWQTRCELFGSADVAKFTQQMIDTNDGPRPARDSAYRELIEAMKSDLRK